MLPSHRLIFNVFHHLSFISYSIILLVCSSGTVFSGIVTLDSIEIFKTHELLPGRPSVYFNCKGESKIDLPDVKKTHVSYTFKGEESWQPLTNFSDKKCKRCGFYEKDIIKSDEFDEWEFCPSDFVDGRYKHLKENEFNATFLCPECGSLQSESNNASESHKGGNGKHLALVITFSILGLVLFILALVAAYKYWRKRKREQDHAQFLKLFEEGDDIEDELGLGPLGGVM